MQRNVRGFCGVSIAIITYIFTLASSVCAAVPPYKDTIHYQPSGHYAGMGMNVKMAVDTLGYLYVVEVYGTTVRKFGTDGELMLEFGTPGTGNGQFTSTRDIAVDSTNNIYIADQGKVQKFDSNGNYLTQWPTANISTLTIGGADNVFVTRGNFVYQYDSAGNQVRWFAAVTSRDILVNSANGHILLTRNIGPGNAIYEYDFDGTLLGSHITLGSGVGQIGSPNGIAQDSSGNIYVADYYDNAVKVFNSSIVYQATWSSIDAENVAVGPTDTIYVSGHITVDNDYLTNSFIYTYNTSGTKLDQWLSFGTGDGELYAPGGVSLDSTGNVYVLDVNNTRIVKYSNAGVYQNKWSVAGLLIGGDPLYAQGIAITGDDEIYVSTQSDASVKKYDSEGNLILTINDFSGSGSADGSFGLPVRLFVDEANNLYVADSYNCKVYVFNSSGAWQREWEPDSGCPLAMDIDSNDGLHILTDGWGVDLYSLLGVYQNETFWYDYQYPTDMAIDANDNIYIADFLDHLIYTYDSSGVMTDSWGGLGQQTTGFHYPYGITVDIVNNVYVADSINSRIMVFGDSEFPVPEPEPTPTPTSIPESEPTPTPTPIPAATTVSVDALTAAPGPGCADLTPVGIPNLFRVDHSGQSAMLYFSPVQDTISEYVIGYGDDAAALDYGVRFNAARGSGIVSYQIDALPSGKTFWFKVRAGNGCAVGGWSNVHSTPLLAPINTDTPSIDDASDNDLGAAVPVAALSPPLPGPTPSMGTVPLPVQVNQSKYILGASTGTVIRGVRNTSAVLVIAEIMAGVAATTIQGLQLIISAAKLASTIGGKVTIVGIAFPALGHYFWERFSSGLRPILHLLHLPTFGRNRSFGVVFNAVTQKPVAKALISFIPKNGNVRTTLSNQAGRYNATLEPESYSIQAEKENHLFPSKIFMAKESVLYRRVYTPDQRIDVSETMPVTNIAIPMDPLKVSTITYILKRVETKMQAMWVQSSLAILFIGQVLSAYIYIVESNTVNLVLLCLFTALFTREVIFRIYEEHFYGLVTNAKGKPLGYTDVDVYRKYEDGYEIYASVMTNRRGKYLLTPENGEYLLKVTDDQHNPVKEVEAVVTDKEPVIRKNIRLDIVQQSGTGIPGMKTGRQAVDKLKS